MFSTRGIASSADETRISSTRPTNAFKKGFTLIELLVVIAIIAILAAILFPVFARARENARRASCMSNMKQVALGVMQYTQDNDEKVPIHYYTLPGALSAGGPRTWVKLIEPYTKSYEILRCPSNTENPGGVWGAPPSTFGWWGNFQLWPSYSWNFAYLNPNGCRENAAGTDYDWQPANQSRFGSPAAMVMFVDTKHSGSTPTTFYRSTEAEAPANASSDASGWDPDECGYTDGGWGEGNYYDNGKHSPKTGTGDFATRHLEGGNVAFVDGHVKFMNAGRLASGTNWYKGIANSAVKITDMNAYLWDYR